MCQLRLFLESFDLATVTHTLVTPWPNYYNALSMGLPLENVKRFHWVQNTAAPLLTGLVTGVTFPHHYSSSTGFPVILGGQFKVLVLI